MRRTRPSWRCRVTAGLSAAGQRARGTRSPTPALALALAHACMLLCSCGLHQVAARTTVPAGCTPVNGSAWTPRQLLQQAQLLATTEAPAGQLATGSRGPRSSPSAGRLLWLCLAPGAPLRVLGSGPFAQGALLSAGELRIQGAAAGGPASVQRPTPDPEAVLDLASYPSTTSAAFTATAGTRSWQRGPCTHASMHCSSGNLCFWDEHTAPLLSDGSVREARTYALICMRACVRAGTQIHLSDMRVVLAAPRMTAASEQAAAQLLASDVLSPQRLLWPALAAAENGTIVLSNVTVALPPPAWVLLASTICASEDDLLWGVTTVSGMAAQGVG